ncbi:uncharacterized protein LOC141638414 [Silene latifolia]|uniref:uncharacterized protein LOC141638414 n=1 Tax=Silene latifolia TaxID=37657 RepID=UPI003D779E8B
MAEVTKLLNACIIYTVGNSKWVSPVQILIHPDDQEKITFTCPHGVFAYRGMSFGLFHAPATFQRCMMGIFSVFIESIREALISAPIIQPPDWELPFEIMYDASDYAIGAVKYATTEKKLLVVVYVLEKLRKKPSQDYCDGYSFFKSLIWRLKTKKGIENVVAAHLSRLPLQERGDSLPIADSFPDDNLLAIFNAETPWYVDYANFIVGDLLPHDLSYHQRKRFFHDVK